jgi:hypothetical protein
MPICKSFLVLFFKKERFFCGLLFSWKIFPDRHLEAEQEFYCAGHPEAVFCAPRLKAEEAAPLRCSKTTSGRRQAAPLARSQEFLPSLFARPSYDRPLSRR